AYLALPLTFSGPSTREMRLPMSLRFSASGHLYSAIALAPFLHILGGLRDRGADADVGSTAAQVAAQAMPDLVRRGTRVLVEQGFAGHHEAGRAEAALLAVVVHKGLLHRVQSAVLFQPLDGLNLFALRLDGED